VTVPNPHDALFQTVFSQPEHAAGALQHILPKDIVARIRWSTLTALPGRFVDKALTSRYTDVLFSAMMDGRTVFLYLLFEHQSTDSPLMAFRLLHYEVRIWCQFLDKHPDAQKLPAILPVVLHHSEKGWTSPTAFEDLLDLDAPTLALLRPFLPGFRFALDDVSSARDEDLRARAMTALGRLALFCFRHAREPDALIDNLRDWLGLVAEVRKAPNGAAALAAIFRYILLRNKQRDAEDVVKQLLLVAGEEARSEVMTAGEQLIERGRQEGVVKGQRLIVLKLLRKRFGALPSEAEARVQAAGADQLDAWAERVLTAATLAEVLE